MSPLTASEVRQIVREELAAALHPSVQRSPRAADGMGGFKTAAVYDPREDDTYAGDPASLVFTPVSGGPARQLKMPLPPQDGGQAVEA